jgi:hypothetical protein
MPNTAQKVMPNNSQSDTQACDFLVPYYPS